MQPRTTPDSARGFTMVEVLVAIVVVSLGLLGLAALQARGLKLNHGAFLQTSATLLAYDMADRMRANTAGVNSAAYDNVVLDTGNPATNPGDPGCNAGPSGCTQAQLAQYDTWKWYQGLSALPQGTGSVVRIPGAPTRFTVTVSWAEAEQTGGANTYARNVAMEFRP
ncbi:MAG: type IV pilus modification protein PilV [Gammaproteobacteria bacterium]